MLKKVAFALALGAASLGAAYAQTPATPRVDQREAHQQDRIANGVASGQLTPHETVRLEKEQARIANTEARAKADGTVTAKERRHLAHMQNRASRKIHQQKHDAQKVG